MPRIICDYPQDLPKLSEDNKTLSGDIDEENLIAAR